MAPLAIIRLGPWLFPLLDWLSCCPPLLLLLLLLLLLSYWPGVVLWVVDIVGGHVLVVSVVVLGVVGLLMLGRHSWDCSWGGGGHW